MASVVLVLVGHLIPVVVLLEMMVPPTVVLVVVEKGSLVFVV